MNHKIRLSLVFTAVFFIDRLSKFLILKQFNPGQSVPVLPDIIHLTRVDNTGAAFGIFQGGTPFLIGISALFILLSILYLFKSRPAASFYALFPWALIVAGAFGNLYDRVFYGYVVDFIDLRVWPVFNIADTGICAGAGLLVLSLIKKQKETVS